MTNSEARRFLQALVRDANDALAFLADGDVDAAALAIACAPVDAANVLVGLCEMANAPRCCKDVCDSCRPLNAAEYA